jgi:ribosomal protein S18 acetylase RimI-like enzyme
MTAGGLRIRSLTDPDRKWVAAFLRERWGSERVAAHGTLYLPAELPGYAAELGGDRVGLVTFAIDAHGCEIVTLDSDRPGLGVGSALVEAVAEAARAAGCTRLWLVTTNENEHARAWYARRGFSLAAVHEGAVDRSRAELKPEIPSTDGRGIPIRDELEFERRL